MFVLLVYAVDVLPCAYLLLLLLLLLCVCVSIGGLHRGWQQLCWAGVPHIEREDGWQGMCGCVLKGGGGTGSARGEVGERVGQMGAATFDVHVSMLLCQQGAAMPGAYNESHCLSQQHSACH